MKLLSFYRDKNLLKNLGLWTASVLGSVAVASVAFYFVSQHRSQASQIEIIKSDEVAPPFFNLVFDVPSKEFIIKDPLVKRTQPFFGDYYIVGPHDVLGFRNRQVSQTADIITIGDSMTYGNNAAIDLNWPNQMANALKGKQPVTVYNMSVGGWGAVEYFEIFKKAIRFKPKHIVVAFYTGNDPLDSFIMAYSKKEFRQLRPDSRLSVNDLPQLHYPPKEEEIVRLRIGGKVYEFTPQLRYDANQDHPAVKAGYDIMYEVARKMALIAKQENIKLSFTIIPTKEFAYAPVLRAKAVALPQVYEDLLAVEQTNIEQLKQRLSNISDANYIDTVKPLVDSLFDDPDLFPSNSNGHPLASGYKVIGETIASNLKYLPPKELSGPLALELGPSRFHLFLAQDYKLWKIETPQDAITYNIDLDKVTMVTARDIAHYQHMGSIADKPGR